MREAPPRLATSWAAARRRIRASTEFDVLARTFFARFFENDVTGGGRDLRNSFFWLIAFLAAPGALIPVVMFFDWEGVAVGQGADALRIASRADKVFYLGFAMVASGLLSAVTWSSLLLDRRDSLVLGTLPVSGRRIVRAKLTALAVYITAVAVGTHSLAALSYGLFLGTHKPMSFAVVGAVAHMVAACSATAFVLFAIVAIQGLLLAAVGPRRFIATSPWLQSVVVGVMLIGMVLLPLVSTSTVDTLAGSGDALRPWILQTPPLWFLGLYEVVLRTDEPLMRQLSLRAVGALLGAGLLTIVVYPVAYRRLVSNVVELSAASTRRGWAARAIEWIVALVSRDAVIRASSQFFLIAVRRSTRHRLTVAMAIGATAAMISPTVFRWMAPQTSLPSAPPRDLLALPLEVILILLVGFRIAAALPADLAAGWMPNSIGLRASPMRAGLWRTMFISVVFPVSLATAASYWLLWGDRWALMHTTMCAIVGAVLIEMLTWGFDGLPCGRPWQPEHANLRKWWPAYIGLFLFITGGLPWIEQLYFRDGPTFTALMAILASIAVVLRITHRRRRVPPEIDLDEPAMVQVLNLD